MANRYCPRCGSTKIVENQKSYRCLECNSEFISDEEIKIEDEDKLTIQEMTGILNELDLDENITRARRLKEILEPKDDNSKT
ncbi:MAG: hypothetical protein EU533_05310 [Promethearchaeota archaeon]|nr:MAG: hypothetical protein EU533_05310 [Candidatus Lokiarchaeota archaeon]